MQVVLVMFLPDGQRRSFSVVRDMTVIGRRVDCDLRIPLGDVSRKHCRLIKDGDAFRVEDLGSSNGTFRNGQRVQQSELLAGDTLQVGPVVFVLQVDGVPGDDELRPVTSGDAVAEPAEEEELLVVEEEAGEGKEFDPMEALNAAEGSGFEFHMEEEAAAAAAGVSNEDSEVAVDLESEPEGLADAPPPLDNAAPAELEEALVELDEAPVELDEAPAEPDEAAAELDEPLVELDEAPRDLGDDLVDLEESEPEKKA